MQLAQGPPSRPRNHGMARIGLLVLRKAIRFPEIQPQPGNNNEFAMLSGGGYESDRTFLRIPQSRTRTDSDSDHHLRSGPLGPSDSDLGPTRTF